jgi:hypothetical protein
LAKAALCLDLEPAAPPLVLRSGAIRVAFDIDLFYRADSYFTPLVERAGITLPLVTNQAFFGLVDYSDAGDELLAVDSCPRGLSLRALAEDSAGVLHALCRGALTQLTPTVAVGTFNRDERKFEWGRSWDLSEEFAGLDPWLLAIVRGQPLVAAGARASWRVATQGAPLRVLDIPLAYGLFTSGRTVIGVGIEQDVERSRHVLSILDFGARPRRTRLRLTPSRQRPAYWDERAQWFDDEPPVLATMTQAGKVTLRLPEATLLGESLRDPGVTFVYSSQGLEPVGGPQVLGEQAKLFAQPNTLDFECAPGKSVRLANRDTRYARTSCSERRCLVLISSSLQPAEPGVWWSESFQVYRLDRSTCTEVAPW